MNTLGVSWVTLNNGVKMPQFGLGVVFLEPGEMMRTAVGAAVDAGYRLFDNAAFYGNEAAVGDALRSTGIDRKELFISTKLRNSQHRYEEALKAFDLSMKTLGVDYLDLYLIHWPCPEYDLYREAWRALEHLYAAGYVRAIGVSNFHVPQLEAILSMCEVRPVVNQLECNPYLSIAPLRQYCQDHEIWPEAWFPLGGPAVKLKGDAPDKVLLDDPLLAAVGEKYEKTPAQIVLRWEIQSGIITIPKSARPERIRQNIDIFDFELSPEDMAAIDGLNYDRRVGPDPETCNDQF